MIINNMCECPLSILSRVLNANVNHLESMTENINEKSHHIFMNYMYLIYLQYWFLKHVLCVRCTILLAH